MRVGECGNRLKRDGTQLCFTRTADIPYHKQVSGQQQQLKKTSDNNVSKAKVMASLEAQLAHLG